MSKRQHHKRTLEDGDRGVDSTTLLEESADGAARSLGGDEDDIDVLRGDDTGLTGGKPESVAKSTRTHTKDELVQLTSSL